MQDMIVLISVWLYFLIAEAAAGESTVPESMHLIDV